MAVLLALVGLPAPASALVFPENSPELPERWCAFGAGAGQCNLPRGVAADPRNGHVYVADQNNERIDVFNALGEFVKAWGWGVDTGASEPQTCTETSGCQAGLEGKGPGQFGLPQGVGVDSAGDVYVADSGLPRQPRIEKFSAAGEFILTFGGEVNKTRVAQREAEEAASEPVTVTEAEENLCTAASGDTCGGGTEGAGQGQFGKWPFASFIAIDEKGTPSTADDVVYVGDVGRIQEFNDQGEYQGQIALPGHTVSGLAVDLAGKLYATYNTEPDVRKIDPASGELASPRFKVISPEEAPLEHDYVPTAVAVDSEADVFAFGPPVLERGGLGAPVYEFDPTGKLVANFGKGEFSGSTGIATNLCAKSDAPGNLYVANAIGGAGPPANKESFLRAYGTSPVGCFKARTGPAEEVKETSATLTGTVIPAGLAVSECVFEWGETTAYGETAGCEPEAGEISGTNPVPVKAQLSPLQKGTVYHYRLVAKVGGERETGSDASFKTLGPPVISQERTVSVASGEALLKATVNPEGFASSYRFDYMTLAAYEAAGESFAGAQSTPTITLGKDGDRGDHPVSTTITGLAPGTAYVWRLVASNFSGTTYGESLTFATYREAGSEGGPCPNEALRGGASAKLPDCRAYEMVSPVDKNGGDIVSALSTTGDPGGYVQAAPGGDSIAYSAFFASFGGQPTSVAFNEYLGGRGTGSWGSEGIHQPIIGRGCCAAIMGANREFLGFSADLCSAWVLDFQVPPLRPDGQLGAPNLYRRSNCGPEAGQFETLTDGLLPQGGDSREIYVNADSLEGASQDGSQAFFRSNAPLGLQDCRTGTAATAISYQWLRNGVPIPGATSPFYEPGEADQGKAVQCQVFAINANAGSTQASNPPALFAKQSGEEISPPTVPASSPPILAPSTSGTLTVGGAGGQTLTCNANAGAWGGSPTFAFQWYRNGVPIAGANASTYLVTAGDVASRAVFQCAITGSNGDGAVSVLSANRATSPAPSGPAAPAVEAANGGEMARVFDRSGGKTNLVSVLPGGQPATLDAAVGNGFNFTNATSDDGSKVYWSSGGKLYLRLHPEQGPVASECTDNATIACTLAVSSSSAASFRAGSANGSRVLYSEETLTVADKLVVFDLAKQEAAETARRVVAGDVNGVAGASADLSRIYFVSEEALAPGASEGEPNLYLDREGEKSLVATLLPGDVGAQESGAAATPYSVDGSPGERPTRVTPSGARIVFESRARLTSFDNTDADSGRPSVEVYSYDATSGKLSCISCNPSGAQPSGGREMHEPYNPSFPHPTLVTAAAWIPTSEHPLHASNVMSEDGRRIFFNSNDALLPGDSNGAPDVYEWEAPGAGSCSESSAHFFARNGGCLYLISSGQSPYEAEFWEASPDGQNVFFTTEESLVPPDPGSVDLYDARVGGGFEYPEAAAGCEGEACQSPPPPPQQPTPSSRSYSGPTNAGPTKPRCPKGRHKVRSKGKIRCVKKRAGHSHHRRAHRGRRAAR